VSYVDDVRVVRLGHTKWVVPSSVLVCYVLFAVAVHLRLLDGLDLAVREAARTREEWGPQQMRAARIAGALRPAHVVLPLGLVVAVLSVLRRSLRPFVVVAIVGIPVVLATVATKWLMRRWDPRILPVGHGSFPSGHVVAVIMAFGLVVLLVRPQTRWGWAVPVVMGCIIGWALIVARIHPATDVLGAGLFAGAALSAAKAAGVGQRQLEPERVR
jgi:membrane-associated phospholipid phosphatase